MTRLLLDENLSPKLAEALRWRGHDAVHAKDAGLAGAPDAVVFAEAGRQARAIVTHDHDYLRLLAARPDGPAVILLPQRGLQRDRVVGSLAQALRLGEVLHALGERLKPGVAVRVGSLTLRAGPMPRPRAVPAMARHRERSGPGGR